MLRLPLILLGVSLAAIGSGCKPWNAGKSAAVGPAPANLILINGLVTSQDTRIGDATALAVAGETLVAVGSDAEILRWKGPSTKVIDAGGRRVIPGLNDSHLHATRQGRFYNTELRWDGVESLARGIAMIREQALRTPKGQWVRVVGGWSSAQFAERRLPTVAELNAAAPTTVSTDSIALMRSGSTEK